MGAARRVRDAVREQVTRGLAQGIFPGAVVAIVQGRARLVFQAFGSAQVVPRRRPMTAGAIFDLASVTKPVATATAVLQLWEQGTIDLDASVAEYLPQFAQGGKAGVTVRHLMAHTSGLPAWEMLYLPDTPGENGKRAPACRSIGQAVARICAIPARTPPGSRVEYSDLGFIILGHVVERISGLSLDRYVRRHIFEPLGMRWTRFVPPRSWRSTCAATEAGNIYEQAKARAVGLGSRFPWRTRVLRGEVHDGNAHYVGRGIAGHAGLFGTAEDMANFGTAMLCGGARKGVRFLSSSTVVEATRNQTPKLDPDLRGLGWALAGWRFLGTRVSALAFGHTGFTGTSIVMDPARDAVIVLLTNRVHPHADSTAIQDFRPAFHDAVIEALDG